MNKEKLIDLKQQLLEDDVEEDDLKMEIKSRKATRIIVVLFVGYMMTSLAFVLSLPIFSRHNFTMPMYAQLPWTT